MDSPTSLTLLDLPPELLLYICTHLTFASLAHLRRASKSLNSLITSSSELLYRRICFSSGFTREASAGSSTAAGGKGAGNLGLKALSEQFDAQELERAVRAQRSMSGAYEGVKTWEELAKRRLTIDRNWLEGRFKERWVVLDERAKVEVGMDGLFRFKLDPEPNLVLASGLAGGNFVFNSSGQLVWSTELPVSHYPHVEMSDGYFTQLISDHSNRFLIWRRSTITFPPSPLPPSHISALLSHSTHHILSSPSFTPYCLVDSASQTNATKLRFPYHLGASISDRKLYRYHLEEHRMETMDISALWEEGGELEDPKVNYVELLGEFSLVAGLKSITFWHPERGYCGSFPPRLPPHLTGSGSGEGEGHHFRANDLAPSYSAVHHDLRPGGGVGNLVAATFGGVGGEGGGSLVWTCDVGGLLREGATAEEVARKTMVLKTNAPILQLAVENGRAAFISAEGFVHKLWLLNLIAFEDRTTFNPDLYDIKCIAFLIPTIMPPSRLEMTSDEILVPTNSIFSPSHPSSLHSAHRSLLTSTSSLHGGAFSWETLGGETKKSYGWRETREGQGDVREKWRDLLERAEEEVMAREETDGTDGWVAYGFGDI